MESPILNTLLIRRRLQQIPLTLLQHGLVQATNATIHCVTNQDAQPPYDIIYNAGAHGHTPYGSIPHLYIGEPISVLVPFPYKKFFP